MRSSIRREPQSRRIGRIGGTGGEIVTELSAWNRGWVCVCIPSYHVDDRPAGYVIAQSCNSMTWHTIRNCNERLLIRHGRSDVAPSHSIE